MVRRRRWLLAALVLAAVAVGCTDAPFVGDGAVVRGRFLYQDGRRVPERPIVVVESPGDVDPDVAAVLGSVGLACAVGDQTGCRGRRQETTTDDGGRFAVDFGEERPRAVEVAAGVPAAPGELVGPTVSQRSAMNGDETLVPDVRVWQPFLALTSQGDGGTVSWPALPEPDLGQAITYRVVFVLGDGQAVWTVTTPTAPAPIDLRLLEDSRGTVSVVALAGAVHADAALLLAYRSALVPYASRIGPPRSRDADCGVTSRSDELVAQPTCGLTDGDLATPFEPDTEPPCRGDDEDDDCREPRHERAEIDLGEAVPVGLIVVRGCNAACRVDLSVDGRTWAPAGTAPADLAAVPVPDTPARYVRVSSPRSIDEVREVSVWSGPTPVAEEPAFAQVPVFEVPDVPAPPVPDDGGIPEERLLVALVAAVLAFSVAAAVVDWYSRTRAL